MHNILPVYFMLKKDYFRHLTNFMQTFLFVSGYIS